MKTAWLSIVALCLLAASAAHAQPTDVPGEVVTIPILADGAITLDGDLGDWATLPATVTNTGPLPSTDPATTGQLRWQVAADQNALYFAATITDATIIAGENGDAFYNEDSIELYLNLSRNSGATTYAPNIGQITISAVDRGNTDPAALTLSGNGAPQFNVTGFVFETTAGWGLEIAVQLDGRIAVASGGEFGIQVQANGSSGGDRDLKLSWSAADVDDSSFKDPSVFGRGVFFVELAAHGADSATEPTEVTDDAATETATVDDAATEVGETVATDAPSGPLDTEPAGNQSLLIAAIVAAATVLFGGIWFERRRKKSEAAAAGALGSGTRPQPEGDADDNEIDDDEFNEMLNSILDEEPG